MVILIYAHYLNIRLSEIIFILSTIIVINIITLVSYMFLVVYLFQHKQIKDMKNVQLTKQELAELCFALLSDRTHRGKTGQKNFEKGRKKLLSALKELEENT